MRNIVQLQDIYSHIRGATLHNSQAALCSERYILFYIEDLIAGEVLAEWSVPRWSEVVAS